MEKISTTKVAFLAYENQVKSILFMLGNLFRDYEWTFRLYTKPLDLANAFERETYQIIFLDEMFHTPRIRSFFEKANPQMLFIFIVNNPAEYIYSTDLNLFYISKQSCIQDLQQLEKRLLEQLNQEKIFLFETKKISIELPFQDIYYLQKKDRETVFHTRLGLFSKREAMYKYIEEFEKAGFIRIHSSYLVNQSCISALGKNQIQVNHKTWLPIARSQKANVISKLRPQESQDIQDE